MATGASNGSDVMTLPTGDWLFYLENRTYSTILRVGISVLVYLKSSVNLPLLLSAMPTSTNLIKNQCPEPSPRSPFFFFR